MSFETEMNTEKELEHKINEQHCHSAQQHTLFGGQSQSKVVFANFFKSKISLDSHITGKE